MDNIDNMNTDETIKNIEALINKYDSLKKHDKMDLSCDQDLTIAVMNLIGIEEHFFFTGAKTNNPEYYDLITEVRNIRKELLHKLVKEPEGEIWCISKHLLASSYRLMEVGTKQLDLNNKKEAYDFFTKAYKLYSLFWGLQMKLIPTDGIKQIDEQLLNQHHQENHSILSTLGGLVKKAVNCCIE
jgi:hypothetical protein